MTKREFKNERELQLKALKQMNDPIFKFLETQTKYDVGCVAQKKELYDSYSNFVKSPDDRNTFEEKLRIIGFEDNDTWMNLVLTK